TILTAELARMTREPPSDGELALAKSYLVGSFPLRLDTSAKVADFVSAVEELGLGLDYADRYKERVGRVTAQDVRRVAQRFFVPESVARAGRHAACRSEAMKPDAPDRLLREAPGRLVLWADLHGPREDFARFFTPRLRVGDREIEPAFVQNERTAVRQADGQYLARCVYAFPTRDLTGTSRVALVVRDADGRDVGRFTLDLSTMR